MVARREETPSVLRNEDTGGNEIATHSGEGP